MSRETTGSTDAAPRSTRYNATPSAVRAGTTSRSASSAPPTLRTVPDRRPSVAVTSGSEPSGPVERGTTSAAVRSPAASAPIATRAAWCSAQASSAVVATTELVRNGTGAQARPSSSCTAAASTADAPAPPSSSGTSSPARPSSTAKDFHSGSTTERSPSYIAVTASEEQRSASRSRTVVRRSLSTSVPSRSRSAAGLTGVLTGVLTWRAPSRDGPCRSGAPRGARGPARRRCCG